MVVVVVVVMDVVVDVHMVGGIIMVFNSKIEEPTRSCMIMKRNPMMKEVKRKVEPHLMHAIDVVVTTTGLVHVVQPDT
ncbi:hypothetical protein HanIR_Chr17g0862611 [Helianthus annuus]|nr:hypothetical protein HanIR_Chr17g0862611 [Helianthus annuus]